VDRSPNSSRRPLLVFDGDCAFCTTSATWLAERLRRDDGANASIVPWQFTDLAALGTTPARAQREVLWVDAAGAVYGGAEAFARWLRFRGGRYALLGVVLGLPGVRQLARSAYRLIAANRHRMPGGSPACELPPAGYDPSEPGRKML
jgi:predicted DCC family thiol-disulfide oxidoreductase YuxK